MKTTFCNVELFTKLRSTRFPHSFHFPSASSSRHLSSFLCQTVPIWNRLPSSVISSTFLSSFRSAVRRHFVSDMHVHLWSILVIFSHSFGRLPHFYLYFFFVYVPTTLLFLVFFYSFFCVLLFHLPEERPPISFMLLANPL